MVSLAIINPCGLNAPTSHAHPSGVMSSVGETGLYILSARSRSIHPRTILTLLFYSGKLEPVSVEMDPKLADKVSEKRTKSKLITHYPKKSIINYN